MNYQQKYLKYKSKYLELKGGVAATIDWSNKQQVLDAVTQDGDALAYASNALKADREVVMAAVTQNGQVLEYASRELRADKDVVITAVTQYGYALLHTSLLIFSKVLPSSLHYLKKKNAQPE